MRTGQKQYLWRTVKEGFNLLQSQVESDELEVRSKAMMELRAHIEALIMKPRNRAQLPDESSSRLASAGRSPEPLAPSNVTQRGGAPSIRSEQDTRMERAHTEVRSQKKLHFVPFPLEQPSVAPAQSSNAASTPPEPDLDPAPVRRKRGRQPRSAVVTAPSTNLTGNTGSLRERSPQPLSLDRFAAAATDLATTNAGSKEVSQDEQRRSKRQKSAAMHSVALEQATDKGVETRQREPAAVLPTAPAAAHVTTTAQPPRVKRGPGRPPRNQSNNPVGSAVVQPTEAAQLSVAAPLQAARKGRKQPQSPPPTPTPPLDGTPLLAASAKALLSLRAQDVEVSPPGRVKTSVAGQPSASATTAATADGTVAAMKQSALEAAYQMALATGRSVPDIAREMAAQLGRREEDILQQLRDFDQAELSRRAGVGSSSSGGGGARSQHITQAASDAIAATSSASSSVQVASTVHTVSAFQPWEETLFDQAFLSVWKEVQTASQAVRQLSAVLQRNPVEVNEHMQLAFFQKKGTKRAKELVAKLKNSHSVVAEASAAPHSAEVKATGRSPALAGQEPTAVTKGSGAAGVSVVTGEGLSLKGLLDVASDSTAGRVGGSSSGATQELLVASDSAAGSGGGSSSGAAQELLASGSSDSAVGGDGTETEPEYTAAEIAGLDQAFLLCAVQNRNRLLVCRQLAAQFQRPVNSVYARFLRIYYTKDAESSRAQQLRAQYERGEIKLTANFDAVDVAALTKQAVLSSPQQTRKRKASGPTNAEGEIKTKVTLGKRGTTAKPEITDPSVPSGALSPTSTTRLPEASATTPFSVSIPPAQPKEHSATEVAGGSVQATATVANAGAVAVADGAVHHNTSSAEPEPDGAQLLESSQDMTAILWSPANKPYTPAELDAMEAAFIDMVTHNKSRTAACTVLAQQLGRSAVGVLARFTKEFYSHGFQNSRAKQLRQYGITSVRKPAAAVASAATPSISMPSTAEAEVKRYSNDDMKVMDEAFLDMLRHNKARAIVHAELSEKLGRSLRAVQHRFLREYYVNGYGNESKRAQELRKQLNLHPPVLQQAAVAATSATDSIEKVGSGDKASENTDHATAEPPATNQGEASAQNGSSNMVGADTGRDQEKAAADVLPVVPLPEHSVHSTVDSGNSNSLVGKEFTPAEMALMDAAFLEMGVLNNDHRVVWACQKLAKKLGRLVQEVLHRFYNEYFPKGRLSERARQLRAGRNSKVSAAPQTRATSAVTPVASPSATAVTNSAAIATLPGDRSGSTHGTIQPEPSLQTDAVNVGKQVSAVGKSLTGAKRKGRSGGAGRKAGATVTASTAQTAQDVSVPTVEASAVETAPMVSDATARIDNSAEFGTESVLSDPDQFRLMQDGWPSWTLTLLDRAYVQARRRSGNLTEIVRTLAIMLNHTRKQVRAVFRDLYIRDGRETERAQEILQTAGLRSGTSVQQQQTDPEKPFEAWEVQVLDYAYADLMRHGKYGAEVAAALAPLLERSALYVLRFLTDHYCFGSAGYQRATTLLGSAGVKPNVGNSP